MRHEKAKWSRIRKWGKHGLLTFVVLCLTVSAVVRCWSREPSLLARAIRVADTRRWLTLYDNYHYDWIANSSVLYTGQEAVYWENTRTHTRTKLRRLSKLTDSMADYHATYAFSPDHKRLLWLGRDAKQVLVVALDGRRHVTWPLGKHGLDSLWGPSFWLPDNQHWVELIEQPHATTQKARIYDVNDPGKVRTVAVRLLAGQIDSSASDTNQRGRLFCKGGCYVADSRCTLTIYESDVRHLSRLPRIHHLILPTTICRSSPDVRFSPNGKRVAFLVESQSANAPPTYRLWTCALDGAGLHEVGQMLCPETDNLPSGIPSGLEWTPDSKRLSFVYQDSLWTVPAN